MCRQQSEVSTPNRDVWRGYSPSGATNLSGTNLNIGAKRRWPRRGEYQDDTSNHSRCVKTERRR
ncbi:hypothetical protein, partial [Gilliamella sp. Pas-s95]|uniref:hypothetical protein n=1 Tax=Gilliamella sp. Pas-s95 TaxID=2687317 RepID=UPI0013230A01